MQTPIIPIDPISHTLNQLSWRLSLAKTQQMEGLYYQNPFDRIMTVMRLAAEAAKTDDEVRALLAQDGVVAGLKRMAVERKAELDEVAAEAEKQAVT